MANRKTAVEVKPAAYHGFCLKDYKIGSARPCPQSALWVVTAPHLDEEYVLCGRHTAELVGGILAATLLHRVGEPNMKFPVKFKV